MSTEMTIAQAAQRSGLSAHTLRYYERIGLIHPVDRGPNGHRRSAPRFQRENRERNLELVARAREIAEQVECTPAQLALAWLLHQGDDVAPIPGTRRVSRVEENAAAADIELTGEQLAALDEAFPPGATAGERYAPETMGTVER
ncbi:MAG: aldo/keto reductase [Thermoleophilaceae bacterium]